MSKKNIKRCVCGGDKRKIVWDGWDGFWNLVCLECQRAPSYASTKDGAIERWNDYMEMLNNR